MQILLISGNLGAVEQFLPSHSRLGFIPTASNIDTNPAYAHSDRAILEKLGHHLVDIDIDQLSTEKAQERLDAVDALYVTGGNTFYLAQQIQQKQLASTLRRIIRGGLPYIGASAGAVILGPSLEPVDMLDDPAAAPLLRSTAGLDVISFVPLPHYGDTGTKALYEKIIQKFGRTYQLVTYQDDEAITVSETGTYQVIKSR